MSDLELDLRVEARDVEVRLAVPAGRTLALLGANGAGKSTLLGTVAGLVAPSRGGVRLGGRDLAGVPPHRRRVALLAQDPLLFPHLSALENVAFGPRATGVGRGEARERARRWLAATDVAGLAERRPHQLSGGQAQRVAIARALAAEPELLLLDEPMAALDVAVTPALRHTLREVLAERTAVLVTHDPLDALLLADEVAVLEAGRVVEQGPAARVLTRPRSDFGARIAGLNLVRGTWREDAVHAVSGVRLTGLVEAGGDPPRAERDAVAVFSPSAVALHRQPPHGSPRNVLAGTVAEIEPLGDRLRVRTRVGDLALAAEVTPAAAAELDLRPGAGVHLAVKATEVTVYEARAATAG